MSKIHLILPVGSTLCGLEKPKEKTNDTDVADCLRCLSAVKGNKAWYRARWENEDRNNALKDISDGLSTLSGFADGMIKFARRTTQSIAQARKENGLPEGCTVCENYIRAMCFLGTGYCSENCRASVEERNEDALAGSI